MNQHLSEEEFIPYLDGRLSQAERQRLDHHLAVCTDCLAQFDELRAVMGVLEEWEGLQPSPGFDAALRARLAKEARRPEPWYTLRPVYAAALAVAVAVAIGLVLWQPAPVTAPPTPVAQTPHVGVEAPTPAGGDELAVLENPVLLENYELLEEFDVLFETAAKEEKKL